MRPPVRDQRLVSLIGEFMTSYLPVVRRRDDDTARIIRQPFGDIGVKLSLRPAHVHGFFKQPAQQAAVEILCRDRESGHVIWEVLYLQRHGIVPLYAEKLWQATKCPGVISRRGGHEAVQTSVQ